LTAIRDSIISMAQTIDLDIADLAPDEQVSRLKQQYVSYRGKGAVVRARVNELPVRQYISLLERGYRISLERDREDFVLVLRPDGSTPRLELRGAHSVVSHTDGRVYTNTTDNRIAVIDGSTRKVIKHIAVGDEPSHLELSRDEQRLYVANSASDNVTIIDTADDRVAMTASTGRRPLLPCVSRRTELSTCRAVPIEL
jgi:YVTN family beta-propeller protein